MGENGVMPSVSILSSSDTTDMRIAQRYGFVKRFSGRFEKVGGDAPKEANKEEERA